MALARVAALCTGKAGEHGFDFADGHGLARGGMERDLGGLEEILGVEARGKALQAHRRDVPIAVTPGALEQIKLTRRAFEKGRAKLA